MLVKSTGSRVRFGLVLPLSLSSYVTTLSSNGGNNGTCFLSYEHYKNMCIMIITLSESIIVIITITIVLVLLSRGEVKNFGRRRPRFPTWHYKLLT